MIDRLWVIVLVLLLALFGTLAGAGEDLGLEQVLVESAATPAEHQALANHFRALAAEARRGARGGGQKVAR